MKKEVRLFADQVMPADVPLWFVQQRAALGEVFLDKSEPYPCHFASQGEVLETNVYTYINRGADGHIPPTEVEELALALREFLCIPRTKPQHRLSLLCLTSPLPGPAEFLRDRETFWWILGQLIQYDRRIDHSKTYTTPEDSAWNMSFSGEDLFTFGMTPAYGPRRSRARSSSVALVFQPMSIFADIRGNTAQGQAAKRRIRDRLVDYDLVPMLEAAGSGSKSTSHKWRQYFPNIDGRTETGECPIQVHEGGIYRSPK